MVTNDGLAGINSTFGRRRHRNFAPMIPVVVSMTVITASISGSDHGQPQQDRGCGGDDANVSITRIYERHPGFLF
jgi:hypothetical protein